MLAQPDRFSGGLRLKVQQLYDLPTARCRFGKYLRVVVQDRLPDITALMREFPPRHEATEQSDVVRALSVRVQLQRPTVRCEVQLGEVAQFFPSDAALASWTAQSHQQQADIVFA